MVNLRFFEDKFDRSFLETKFAILNRDSLGTDAAGIMQYFLAADANFGRLD